MGKTRGKSRSELEELRGEIRKLRSENRKLKREVKDFSKRAHFYEEVVDEVAEDIEKKRGCKECGKGYLQEIDLKYLVLTKCDTCDFQRKRKVKHED